MIQFALSPAVASIDARYACFVPFGCMTKKGQTSPLEQKIMCHTAGFHNKPSLNGSKHVPAPPS
ncbi:hypothetical protein BBO01nite_04760 [Brevibacillus borstelensis]|jgi:hypothetical protein|nr:hypothetical protein BBO01nite_04760 [Brevibacillus borstelensis]